MIGAYSGMERIDPVTVNQNHDKLTLLKKEMLLK